MPANDKLKKLLDEGLLDMDLRKFKVTKILVSQEEWDELADEFAEPLLGTTLRYAGLEVEPSDMCTGMDPLFVIDFDMPSDDGDVDVHPV